MKKSFKSRVITHLKSDRWQIEEATNNPLIDFFSYHNSTFKKAYKIRQHGHLLKAEVKALQEYGRTNNMHVLYAHESEGREIRFVRLYPRVSKSGVTQ
jgi:hypothetical protein